MPERTEFYRTKINVALAVNDLQRKLMRYFSQYAEGLIHKRELENCVDSYLKSVSVNISEQVKAIKF